MKVAVATDDLTTVSAHFGRAQHYLVYEVEAGVVKGREVREKVGHGPAMGEHQHADPGQMTGFHGAMLSSVADCEVVISRGMGRPMYESIRSLGKKAFITRTQNADDAVRALVSGNLDNHPELLH